MSPHPESKWTHQICVPCWNVKFPDRKVIPQDYAKGATDLCCYCEVRNNSGIYHREDPEAVHG